MTSALSVTVVFAAPAPLNKPFPLATGSIGP